MSKCEHCIYAGRPCYVDPFACRVGGGSKFEERETISNADRLRGMSDEELAKFLWEINGSNRYWKCFDKYIDWLKQPAKEEHHEAD